MGKKTTNKELQNQIAQLQKEVNELRSKLDLPQVDSIKANKETTEETIGKFHGKVAGGNTQLSEDQFRKILDNAPEPIFIQIDKKFAYVNKAAIVLYGARNEDELLGKNVLDRVHPDFIEIVTERIRQNNQLNVSVANYEHKHLKLDNSIIFVEVSAIPVKFNNKTGGLVFVRDITEKRRIEDEVRQKSEEIETFFDCALDLLCIANTEGYFIHVNKEWENVLGYPVQDLENRRFIDLVHPDDVDSTLQTLNKLINQELVINFINRYRCTNGEYRWIEWKSFPKGGKIYAAARDITSRIQIETQLRESKEQLRFAFEGSNDGLWDVDMKTGGVFISPRGCEILGYKPEEMSELVKAWYELVHPEDLSITNECLQAHLNNKTPVFEVEQRLRMKSGEWKWILSRGKLVSRDTNGNPLRMTGTHTDITERKLAEEAILKKNSELASSEEEIRTAHEELLIASEALSETNAELVLAKERAEESDRLKTAFLQNMSHEIRTPMNAIMGFSELLCKNYANQAKIEHYTKIIIQRCNDLLDIINDILDISKIESGQLSVYLENCNLNNLFDELSTFFNEQKTRLNKEHLAFDFQTECDEEYLNIVTDKIKLKQIFINLLSNAFKFTEKGKIQAGCKLDSDKRLIFFISDTGIGIAKEKHQFIFERFTQVESGHSRIYGGTGLGLPIVKGLVDLLGGEIWLESEPGKGTTFYFTINYEKVNVPNALERERLEKSNLFFNNQSVLIVEDDEYNMLMIEEMLSDIGLNLLKAITGNEAIHKSLEHSPDLILMDIGLPDINCYDAVREILLQKPAIKIIAQTAFATEEDRARAMDAGCVDYISKPLKTQKLLSLVKKYLSK